MRTRWLAAAVALLTVAACADPSGVLTTVGGDPVTLTRAGLERLAATR